MKKVLILGANGQIAREAIKQFLEEDFELTLYLRKVDRLSYLENNSRVYFVEGDVLDSQNLEEAMKGQDIVYANLNGNLEAHAKSIVNSMRKANINRLIFVSSMGIYDEVPGQVYRSILDPYRDSVKVIENSDLNYTIIRPAWLSNEDEINYETTKKGETFKNADAYVSRKSVAHLIIKLVNNPNFGIKDSLGIHRKK
jgi:nucleoside-diphosphate-sugar epimerase